MTKNYYYDCAIKAAYMAKNFGMIFGVKHQGKIVFEAIATFDKEINNWVWRPYKTAKEILERDDNSPFYIHPDSLPLLDPQVGDFGRCWSMRAGDITEINGDIISLDVNGGDWDTRIDAFDIIQRKGQSFIWPESEIIEEQS